MSSPETRRELGQELSDAREQTDNLFRLIDPDAIYDRPVAERHRLIFYLGHFEAFDWNVLARRSRSETAFHTEFDRLFERGIDPPPGQAPADSVRDWPSRQEVEQYGAKTRAWIDAHVNELDPFVLQMAIEHRYMHAETLAYLMHGLPYAKKRGTTATQVSQRLAPENPLIPISGGAATLGKTREFFGWDNEHLAHQIVVPPFSISKFKISNGEYLEFVREGGPIPHFWLREGDAFFYRGMFARFPLPIDWPVWVTWEQAAAYAKWRGADLPGEAQFHRAAAQTSPDPARDNYGFQRWDPVAVDAGQGHTNGDTPAQMIGNGWEWTSDLFAPFSGFEAHPYYPGYSADFFDSRHYVMKGASPRTANLLTRPSFRNWFRPDYPYMYAGFRVVGR
jgi:formylglycine-generating enzyme required for sulfatase activity